MPYGQTPPADSLALLHCRQQTKREVSLFGLETLMSDVTKKIDQVIGAAVQRA
jgi:hypothetical protein